MRIPATCPSCDRKVAQALWFSPPERFSTTAPWQCLYELNHGECHHCGAKICSLTTEFDRDNAVVWTKSKQHLEEGRDYTVLRRRPRSRITGRKPLEVAWAWHPMPVSGYDVLVGDSLASDDVWRDRTIASILILGSESDGTMAFRKDLKGSFDEVWRLLPHVMSGQQGPYPSLRAELSIVQTLHTLGLRRVAHYWPGASMYAQNRVVLASPADLAKMWSTYARSKIKLSVES